MISSRLVVWLLCAGAVAVACGPRMRAATAPASPGSPATHQQGDSLVLASSLNVSVRDGVSLVLHVTNTTDSPVELRFRNGQRYDFAVLDSAGRRIWRWSDERMFTQALQTKLLGPKETISFEERWDAGDRHGHFTAVATLLSSTHPLEQRIEFSLP